MHRTKQIQSWRRYRRAHNKPQYGKWFIVVFGGMLAVSFFLLFSTILWTTVSAASVYTLFAQNLPDPSSIQTEQVTYETVKIYDRTGKHLLYESIDPRPFRGDRTYLPADQIPELVKDATIALEDRNFYTNIGVNLRGLGRALISNLRGQTCRAPARSRSSWSRTS